VVEDAAQAIGAEYHGKRAGNLGTLGCFSFYPSKNLGGFGDGGMVTTNDADLADRIRILRDQGAQPKYYHKLAGGNFRLDPIQAAVLRVKLTCLESWHARRQENARYYTRRFRELGLIESGVRPPRASAHRHVFNQYVIRAQRRDDLKAYLERKGISTEIYYPIPVHLQECMIDRSYREGDFPVAETVCSEVLALPIYPGLSQDQMDYVVESFKEFYLP